ncbi:MAG: hypothetical protein Ta2B_29870 [Termitinemataceae bacterium]|nr:MAG: hypothetical protein Ta2B_29870 [Termitinemataceae bacterium]
MICAFNACAAEKVLDLSKKSAESRLAKKQLVFMLDAATARLPEIARIDPSAPFYAALLLNDIEPNSEKVQILMETATKNPAVHKMAAEKLIPMDIEKYFSLYTAKPWISEGTVWADAFELVQKLSASNISTVRDKGYVDELRWKTLDFFLAHPAKEPQKWAFAKISETNAPITSLSILNQAQISAIMGHFAVSRSSYGEASRDFKITVTENPSLFFRYKELLSDLGKTYQYSSPKDGSAMFSRMEAAIDKADMSGSDFSVQEARYLLLYYAGRMKRQSKEYAEAESFFVKALKIAPNNLQKDACIWYIIDDGWIQSAAKAVAAMEKYAPMWTDPLYFSDIFEKISLYYTTRKRWDSLAQYFPVVRSYADDESRAKFAYLLGRAYHFGFLTEVDAKKALGSSSVSPKPEDFYTIAYDTKDYRGTTYTPFYYHSLAANRLFKRSNFKLPKKTPSTTESAKKVDTKEEQSEKIIFFENFFRFGCAHKIYPYLKAQFDDLSIEELRHFAEKLETNQRYGDSLRLSLAYMGRSDYEIDRRDLELCYPKAFRDVVEPISKKTGMESTLLYALMRTESIFIPDIVSRAGAMGLTQLMPATGTEMARTLKKYSNIDLFENGELNFFDPQLNVHLGAAYYTQLYERTGSRLLALLAYNGGIGRVNRWRKKEHDLSEDLFLETIELTETREYGKKVLAAEAVYSFLYD